MSTSGQGVLPNDSKMSSEKLEDKIKCILCRKQICGVKQAVWWISSKLIETWDVQCIDSLCEILFKSECQPVKKCLLSGGYCVTCQERVWDLDFTLKMLKKVQTRISTITQTILRDILENYEYIEDKESLLAEIEDLEVEEHEDFKKITENNEPKAYSYDQAVAIMHKALNTTKTFSEVTTMITVKVDPDSIRPRRDEEYSGILENRRIRPNHSSRKAAITSRKKLSAEITTEYDDEINEDQLTVEVDPESIRPPSDEEYSGILENRRIRPNRSSRKAAITAREKLFAEITTEYDDEIDEDQDPESIRPPRYEVYSGIFKNQRHIRPSRKAAITSRKKLSALITTDSDDEDDDDQFLPWKPRGTKVKTLDNIEEDLPDGPKPEISAEGVVIDRVEPSGDPDHGEGLSALPHYDTEMTIKSEAPDVPDVALADIIDDYCRANLEEEDETNREDGSRFVGEELPTGGSAKEVKRGFCYRSDSSEEDSEDYEYDDPDDRLWQASTNTKIQMGIPVRRTKTRPGWVKRVRIRKRTFPCSQEKCKRLFIDELGMLMHVRKDHQGDDSPYPCPKCDRGFTSHSNLKAHLLRHEGKMSFFCKTCEKGFHSKLSLKLHCEANHTYKTFEHNCTICSKGFETAPELEAHQPIHQGSSPFSCEDCTQVFTNTGDLVRHVQSLHQRFERPFCSICGKTFSTQSYLQVHTKLIHADKSGVVFTCKICNITFEKLTLLRAHQKSLHTVENEDPSQCEKCGKAFKGIKSLMYHMRTHTGERPYVCKLCGKGFKLGSHLKKHEQMHSGIRNFVCQTCGYACTNKDNLRLHEKIHDKNAVKRVYKRKRKPNPNKPEASEKKSKIIVENKATGSRISEMEGTTAASSESPALVSTHLAPVSMPANTAFSAFQVHETPPVNFGTGYTSSAPQQPGFRLLTQPMEYIVTSSSPVAGTSYYISTDASNVTGYRF